MKIFLKAALASLLLATGAQAADLSAPVSAGGYKDAYIPDTWWEAGDVFVRVRAEAFLPNSSGTDWKLNGASSPALAGANLTVQDVFLPELDLSYFFTRNIAVELVCCFEQAYVHGAGSLSNLKIGNEWFFPPTLLLQYHFDGFGRLKPYVGAGVNYTAFFDSSASAPFKDFKLSTTWAAALQAGADYQLSGNWFANIDFKYLFHETDASVNLNGNHVTAHVDVDPIIVGAGIGYRFGTYAPLK